MCRALFGLLVLLTAACCACGWAASRAHLAATAAALLVAWCLVASLVWGAP